MCQYLLIRNRCIYKIYYFVTTASSICKSINIHWMRTPVIAPRATMMCAVRLPAPRSRPFPQSRW